MSSQALPPLPVTVISGYLGAGKTSLINHLLRHAGGRRIMVMVNDFGALNIDADLLVSADEDTLTLSNGCICCTMGTELLYALSDALDRRPRPDCLVIEASGVAEPGKIAAAAHAEPEMRYCGIVAMADAANIHERLKDPLIGAQVAAQLRVADLILVTKADLAPFDAAAKAVAGLTPSPILPAPHGVVPVDLLLDRAEATAPAPITASDHGASYQSWSASGGVLDRAALMALLKNPPAGLYRFKGHVAFADGGAEVQLVGRTLEINNLPHIPETRVAAVGVAPAFQPDALERYWRSALA